MSTPLALGAAAAVGYITTASVAVVLLLQSLLLLLLLLLWIFRWSNPFGRETLLGRRVCRLFPFLTTSVYSFELSVPLVAPGVVAAEVVGAAGFAVEGGNRDGLFIGHILSKCPRPHSTSCGVGDPPL